LIGCSRTSPRLPLPSSTAFAGAAGAGGTIEAGSAPGHRLARRSVRERLGRPRWRPRESRSPGGRSCARGSPDGELRRSSDGAAPDAGAIPAAQTAPAPLRWPDLGLAERVAINTAAQLVGQFLVLAGGLVAVAVTTRYLGLRDYGSLVTARLRLVVRARDRLRRDDDRARELAKRPLEARSIISASESHDPSRCSP